MIIMIIHIHVCKHNEYVKIYVLKTHVRTLVWFLIFSDRTPLFYLIELNNNWWFILLKNNFTMEIKVTIKCTIYGVEMTFQVGLHFLNDLFG